MLGSEYRWLLMHPLVRGSLLSLALAAFCTASLLVASGTVAPAAVAPALASAADTSAGLDQQAAWPRTALRLWFLAPQLLPLPPR